MSDKYARGADRSLRGPTNVKVGPVWLDARAAKFVDEYVTHFNGTRAAIATGSPPGGASVTAHDWLRRPNVIAAVTWKLEQRREKLSVTAEDQALFWRELGGVDLTVFHPVGVGACRHCHGIDHLYQYKDNELLLAVRTHQLAMERRKDKDRVPFDDLGGGGYDFTADPDPECPECRGLGAYYPRPIDVSKLTLAQRAAYNGCKITRDGIEIKFKDAIQAMENFETLVGMRRARRPLKPQDVDDLDDSELDGVIETMMDRGYLSPSDVRKVIDVMPVQVAEKESGA